jgi:pimeloyl-ACP methyl ester carboxylesterase
LTDGVGVRGIAHWWVDVCGLRLHCGEARAGPLVVLLHGFPELWYAWRHQIPALAAAGDAATPGPGLAYGPPVRRWVTPGRASGASVGCFTGVSPNASSMAASVSGVS